MTAPDHFEVLEDADVSIDVSISGAGISEMYWDMDTDRLFETTVDTADLSTNFTTSGTRWLRFRVKDVYSTYWDLEPVIVDVSNTAPTVEMVPSLELLEGDSHTFSPDVQDTPGDLSRMEYVWTGPSGEKEPGGPERTVIFDQVGNYLIMVSIT